MAERAGGHQAEVRRDRPAGRERQAVGRRAVGEVGRIQRLKGLEVLLRAFARMSDPDTRLVVVGGQRGTGQESREISRLQHLAVKLDVADRTSFVGAVSHEQLPLYYSSADITVMPSSYESFGLVAVESLACGTPVVATRVGGLTSIVRDGETGFLTPPGNPTRLAARIRQALANPATLEAVAQDAQIARQRRGVARDVDDAARAPIQDCLNNLWCAADPRRVDHQPVDGARI